MPDVFTSHLISPSSPRQERVAKAPNRIKSRGHVPASLRDCGYTLIWMVLGLLLNWNLTLKKSTRSTPSPPTTQELGGLSAQRPHRNILTIILPHFSLPCAVHCFVSFSSSTLSFTCLTCTSPRNIHFLLGYSISRFSPSPSHLATEPTSSEQLHTWLLCMRSSSR
ncbi:hypothetical protein LZ30DRAFT_202357 [Colletotrichum cereale]|nr:hypothetical protein LZ30DRAFT_202357 [Colletotrichum cereale]